MKYGLSVINIFPVGYVLDNYINTTNCDFREYVVKDGKVFIDDEAAKNYRGLRTSTEKYIELQRMYFQCPR